MSPRKKDEAEIQRQNFAQMKHEKSECINTLKDLKRQIPSLAADFSYELNKQQGNIQLLIGQTSDLKGEIICLEEEKKSLRLVAKIQDEKIKAKEWEVSQLQKRAVQVENEITEFIDNGDNHYNELRQEVRDQDDMEQALGDDINALANQSNIQLRAKLMANKFDLERMMKLGKNGQRAIGVELEK